MATVELRFSALPAHVRTARLVAAAVARRSGVDEAVLDEVRLAVGEACSRAVHLHRRHCPDRPVLVTLVDDLEAFRVGGQRRGARRDDGDSEGYGAPDRRRPTCRRRGGARPASGCRDRRPGRRRGRRARGATAAWSSG